MKEPIPISLLINFKGFLVILAVFLSLVLSWAWGAVLKAALGVSRWLGLSIVLPGVNIIVFLAAGWFSHRKLVTEANEAAFQQVKRMVEKMATK